MMIHTTVHQMKTHALMLMKTECVTITRLNIEALFGGPFFYLTPQALSHSGLALINLRSFMSKKPTVKIASEATLPSELIIDCSSTMILELMISTVRE